MHGLTHIQLIDSEPCIEESFDQLPIADRPAPRLQHEEHQGLQAAAPDDGAAERHPGRQVHHGRGQLHHVAHHGSWTAQLALSRLFVRCLLHAPPWSFHLV